MDDCLADTLSCVDGQCQQIECNVSAECTVGASCIQGYCAATMCESSADCEPRQRCFEGACRSDICNSSAECASDEICAGRPPVCRLAPSRCADDTDCPFQRFCHPQDRVCVEPCSGPESCQAEEFCVDGFCMRQCSDHEQCDGSDLCFEGECQAIPTICPGCPAHSPLASPVDCRCLECFVTQDCDASDSCVQGLCRYCEAIGTDCVARGLIQAGDCCVECLGPVDCNSSIRSICERGRCVEPSPLACQGDQDCSSLSRCQQGLCVRVSSGQPCEFQQDCPDDEACYGDGVCRQELDVCGCEEPARCVAERGDTVGVCKGCPVDCQAEGCPQGQICRFLPDASQGFCADATLAGCD